jgi:hypothetical protein
MTWAFEMHMPALKELVKQREMKKRGITEWPRNEQVLLSQYGLNKCIRDGKQFSCWEMKYKEQYPVQYAAEKKQFNQDMREVKRKDVEASEEHKQAAIDRYQHKLDTGTVKYWCPPPDFGSQPASKTKANGKKRKAEPAQASQQTSSNS